MPFLMHYIQSISRGKFRQGRLQTWAPCRIQPRSLFSKVQRTVQLIGGERDWFRPLGLLEEARMRKSVTAEVLGCENM